MSRSHAALKDVMKPQRGHRYQWEPCRLMSRCKSLMASLNLSNEAPLWIGFGAQKFFDGAMADLRLYDGALDAESIRKLAASPSARAAAGEALVPQHGGKLQLLAPNAEQGTSRAVVVDARPLVHTGRFCSYLLSV